MNINDIDILIEKSEEKTSLLNELKESIIYESKTYHLINFRTESGYIQTVYNNIYALYRISDKKELVCGNIGLIKSYIKLRNIDTNDIYSKTNVLNY